jgi:hypothetical protein
MTERMNKWVTGVVSAIPSVKIQELTCRSASCKLVLFSPTAEAIRNANHALYETNQTNMMGVVGTEPVQDGYVRPFYLLFSAWRDIEAHRARFGP